MRTKIYLKDDIEERDLIAIQNEYFASWFHTSRDEKGMYLEFHGRLDQNKLKELAGVRELEYLE